MMSVHALCVIASSQFHERTMAATGNDKVASRLLLCLFPVLILAGCVSNQITETEITTDTVNHPETGVVSTRILGERLVAKGIQTTAPAVEVVEAAQFGKKEGEASVLTCAKTVLPGSWFKRGVYKSGSSQADCFGPVTFRGTHSDGTTSPWGCDGAELTGDICRDHDGNYFLASVRSRTYLQQDFDHIRGVRKVVESKSNFVQELIYNGRVGSNLKFIYKEFSDDIRRPSFTEVIEHDYSKSPIVEFKNLRLEIIHATDTQLTYKVIHSF